MFIYRDVVMSEQNTDSKEKTLSELVEMIVEKGTLSPQDQLEINQVAQKGFRGDDSAAVEKLTTLVSGGKIQVI